MTRKIILLCIALVSFSYGSQIYSLADADSLRDVCLKGAAKPCVILSELYAKGDIDTSPDKYEAIKYSKLACRRDSPLGCFSLAKGYETGEALPRSRRKALEFMQRSCKLGFEKACEYYK